MKVNGTGRTKVEGIRKTWGAWSRAERREERGEMTEREESLGDSIETRPPLTGELRLQPYGVFSTPDTSLVLTTRRLLDAHSR